MARLQEQLPRLLLLAMVMPMSAGASPIVLVGYQPDIAAAQGVTAGPIDATGSGATFDLLSSVTPSGTFLVPYETVTVRVAEDATSGPSAVSTDSYFQFHVAADPGKALDLFSLTFLAYKGGASDPRGWVLRSSVDGFASDVASGVVTADPHGGSTVPDAFSVDLSAAPYQGLADITLRMYAYTPTTNFVVNFTGLELNGSVVPEPSTFVLVAIGLLSLGMIGWRRTSTRSSGCTTLSCH